MTTSSAVASALSPPISDLGEDGFELLQSIPVVIRPEEGEYLASFFDANIHATGETDQEAYDNLRSLILDTYEILSETDLADLARPASRQLRVLSQYVRRT